MQRAEGLIDGCAGLGPGPPTVQLAARQEAATRPPKVNMAASKQPYHRSAEKVADFKDLGPQDEVGVFFVQRQTDESVWCRHRGDSGGQMMKGKAEEFIKGVSRPKVNMQR